MIYIKDIDSSKEDFADVEIGQMFEWHNGRTYIKISDNDAALMLEDDDLEDMKEVVPLH